MYIRSSYSPWLNRMIEEGRSHRTIFSSAANDEEVLGNKETPILTLPSPLAWFFKQP